MKNKKIKKCFHTAKQMKGRVPEDVKRGLHSARDRVLKLYWFCGGDGAVGDLKPAAALQVQDRHHQLQL